jgi:hypothetical protein
MFFPFKVATKFFKTPFDVFLSDSSFKSSNFLQRLKSKVCGFLDFRFAKLISFSNFHLLFVGISCDSSFRVATKANLQFQIVYPNILSFELLA